LRAAVAGQRSKFTAPRRWQPDVVADVRLARRQLSDDVESLLPRRGSGQLVIKHCSPTKHTQNPRSGNRAGTFDWGVQWDQFVWLTLSKAGAVKLGLAGPGSGHQDIPLVRWSAPRSLGEKPSRRYCDLFIVIGAGYHNLTRDGVNHHYLKFVFFGEFAHIGAQANAVIVESSQ
jgi:hypothetical protein